MYACLSGSRRRKLFVAMVTRLCCPALPRRLAGKSSRCGRSETSVTLPFAMKTSAVSCSCTNLAVITSPGAVLGENGNSPPEKFQFSSHNLPDAQLLVGLEIQEVSPGGREVVMMQPVLGFSHRTFDLGGGITPTTILFWAVI